MKRSTKSFTCSSLRPPPAFLSASSLQSYTHLGSLTLKMICASVRTPDRVLVLLQRLVYGHQVRIDGERAFFLDGFKTEKPSL